MNSRKTVFPIALAFAFVPGWCLLAGCGGGGGPDLASVEGTVLLDGEPLPDATVEFQPEEEGAPSYGTTDGDGRYALQYTHDKSGAMLGRHIVRITTAGLETNDAGEEIQHPEQVPAKFNHRSELREEVAPGSNTIDFELDSEGEIIDDPSGVGTS